MSAAGIEYRDDGSDGVSVLLALSLIGGAPAVPRTRAAWIALGPFWPAAMGMLLAQMPILIYRAKHDKRAFISSTSQIPVSFAGSSNSRMVGRPEVG
jgi:hypothetical protein